MANKLLTEEDDIDERTLCRVLSLLVLTTSSVSWLSSSRIWVAGVVVVIVVVAAAVVAVL